MYDYSKENDEKNLDYIVDLFRQEKLSIYVADVTKPEIRSAGFYVYKAIIPGYVDLDVVHKFRQLNNSRLLEYQRITNSKINDNPHPFP